MTFLWSFALPLLVVVPLLVAAYVWALRRRRPSGVRYSSLSLVRAAAPGASRLRRHLPFALFVAAVASLVVAMARPAAILAVPTSQTTIILALDVSGSMCSTDIPPTRLEAAEKAAADFIEHQGSSTQIGIVAFSTFAQVVQPPTNDKAALLSALQSLTTGQRTAIGSGIVASIDAISQIDEGVAPSDSDSQPGPSPTPVPTGAYAPDIVVLLTDGVSNTGPTPTEAAQEAAARGVRVYPIGFGTAQGGPIQPQCGAQFLGREPLGGGGFGPGGGFGGGFGAGGGQRGFRRGIDEATLEQVASLTGGKYYPAESAGQLQSVFDNLPLSLVTKHEVVELSVAFVALGGLLAAAGLLLGRLWRPSP